MAHLFLAAAPTGELAALRAVARLFTELGHHTEVFSDGTDLGRRLQEALPDVLVSELVLPHRDFLELMRDLQGHPERRRMRTVVLVSLSAELGGLLPLAWNWRSEIDHLVARPPHGGRRGPDPVFREQVVLAIGKVMADGGLNPLDDASPSPGLQE